MGTFDNYKDTPNAIINEGQEISIKFEKTSPTTGRISWNIPPSSMGCSSDDRAYNGIVITLDTSHTTVAKSPVFDSRYEADATANRDIHAGDRIDTSLVVGAFYDDTETTFLDVYDLVEHEAYYVSGFAVDKVYRYHTQGAHAYSLNITNEHGTPDTAGCQDIKLSSTNLSGVDLTNLTLATDYTFRVNVDDPNKISHDVNSLQFNNDIAYTVTVNGNDAQTYQDLINSLNVAFAKMQSPFIGNVPPSTNAYYWDSSTLYQWNGYEHIKQDVIIEGSDPTVLNIGNYWYNSTNLSIWDGLAWIVKDYLDYHKDFTKLTCDDYWYNGVNIYNNDGNVWCSTTTYTTNTDPSLSPVLSCGSFWYDTNTNILYKLDSNNVWNSVNAVYWNVEPNNLTIGTYWFNDTLNELNKWDGAVWESLEVVVNNIEPINVPNGGFWYKPSESALYVYDSITNTWGQLNVLIYHEDPTDVISCDLYWDINTDELKIWSVTTSSWVIVDTFIQSTNNPIAEPVLTVGVIWNNNNTDVITKWSGAEWVPINIIYYPTDPTIRIIGDVWFDNINKIWYVWDGINWINTDVIASLNNPTAATLPINSLWYNTSNNSLQMWNGLSWIAIGFSTTPLSPPNDTLWFNTTDNTLYKWYKKKWAEATPLLTASLVNGGIKLCSTKLGHASNVLVEQINGNLFSLLSINGVLEYYQYEGTDGVSNQSLYDEIGIGTDGSDDEIRELLDTIRAQMGGGVVEVELTKQQMRLALSGAVEELRVRSGVAYKRGFFFMDLKDGEQRYLMTNKGVGFDKIVSVMNIYRTSGAFVGALYDNAQFGQMAINHLYNMGTYDLISFHIVADYIEQLEQMFATRILFQFNEMTRALDILQSVHSPERVLLDVTVERSIQDLIMDRKTKTWIENYTMANCMITLSQIRGKYGTLPGANGIQLNASDLYQQATEIIERLHMELDSYIVETPEEYGMESTMIIG